MLGKPSWLHKRVLHNSLLGVGLKLSVFSFLLGFGLGFRLLFLTQHFETNYEEPVGERGEKAHSVAGRGGRLWLWLRLQLRLRVKQIGLGLSKLG